MSAPLHRGRRRRRRRRDGAVASCRRAPGGKPLRVTARPRLQAAGVALLSLCTRWILIRETVRGVREREGVTTGAWGVDPIHSTVLREWRLMAAPKGVWTRGPAWARWERGNFSLDSNGNRAVMWAWRK